MNVSIAAICLFLTALLSCNPRLVPLPPDGASVPEELASDNGLNGSDRDRFYHLPEGSEVYPLGFLFALKDSRTGEDFLSRSERFGLLRDKTSGENPYGLPIGLSIATPRDLRIQMVGINCAACHVGQLEYQGRATRIIDGAPNMFDLTKFYGELATSSLAVVSNMEEAWTFLRRLNEIYARSLAADKADLSAAGAANSIKGSLSSDGSTTGREAALFAPLQKMSIPPGEDWIARFDSVESLRETGGADGMALAAQLEEVFSEEAAREADADALFPGEFNSNAMKDWTGASPLLATVESFRTTLRLLKARASFLVRVAESHHLMSPPGFGRLDAFGSARNLMFPEHAAEANAPVSWPCLWDMDQFEWYHWDANTRSLLERNVGQALGVGAALTRTTFESTVILGNLVELEELARRITPPSWPEELFGPIDDAKFQQGAAIFQARCAACHVDGGLFDVGTDPLRAENFGRPVGDVASSEAIFGVMSKVIERAGGDPGEPQDWRITRKYVARPLTAVWATAPYLHNGSVPTIYHLLLPEEERPRLFPIGHREYDPVKVGLALEVADPPGTLSTDEPGNSNAGHSGPAFGTDLSEEERYALLEYLKGM